MNLKNIKQWEKFSSLSAFNSFEFEGSAEQYAYKLYSMQDEYSQIPIRKNLFETTAKHTIDEMGSSIVSLGFFCFLAKLIKPKVSIEIGSFVGFSTCNLASCLPEEGKIYSLEKFDEFARIAKDNVVKFGLDQKAEIIVGDAKANIEGLLEKIGAVDLAFIDGNKEDYAFYFDKLIKKLSKTGLIIIDDVFFHGDVVNDNPKTEKGRGVKKLLENIAQNPEVNFSILPISNGIALVNLK